MTSFLILWLAGQIASVILVWRFTIGLGRPAEPGPTPSVAIIVAVKGHDPAFDEFIARLFEQDYPAFRVIFAVEAQSDPAVALILKCQELAPDRIALAVAGGAETEGQKTANLRAALDELTDDDEVVVFADADIWPERDWLRRLVGPLTADEADVVTGFTWLIPMENTWATKVLVAMAAAIVTLPRLPFMNAAWGGSTALLREKLDALDMEENWRGTLSDDLHLTTVARAAGYRIAVPREILPRTPIHTTGFGDVFAQAKRWYMLVRVHMPAAYMLTLLATTFTAAGWLVALIATLLLRFDAMIVLGIAAVCSIVRMFGRARIVMRVLGKPGLDQSMRYLLTDPVVSPFATGVSALCGWSALLKRRTTWAGITYEVNGPQEVRVIARGASSTAATG